MKFLRNIQAKIIASRNERTIGEVLDKEQITEGQLSFLRTNPNQEILFEQYLGLVATNNQDGLKTFRKSLSMAQMADILRRGDEFIKKGIE